MREHAATRTLVKSAPELWLTCSEESLLGRHLDQFGEIRITRLEPESTVAWEGDAASGTVRIEPSGWGTRVTLTVVAKELAGARAVADELVEAAAEQIGEEVPGQVVEPVDSTVVDERLVTAVSAAQSEPVAPELDEPVPPAQPTEVDPQPPVDEAIAAVGFWSRLLALLRGAGSEAGHASSQARSPFAEQPRPALETPPPVAGEQPLAPEAPSAATDGPLPVPDGALDAPPAARYAPGMAHAAPEIPERPGPTTTADQPSGPPRALDLDAALTAALESLGRAHHRPYSRS
jgi:hypothetical protein